MFEAGVLQEGRKERGCDVSKKEEKIVCLRQLNTCKGKTQAEEPPADRAKDGNTNHTAITFAASHTPPTLRVLLRLAFA